MTKLGQWIYDEAANDQKLQIAKNLIGCLSDEVIAEKTGLSLETVLKIKAETSQNA